MHPPRWKGRAALLAAALAAGGAAWWWMARPGGRADPPPLPPAREEGPPVRRPLPSPEELARLPPDGGPGYNRLVFEKSPYLLRHAGNPVDWHPWGAEAFEKARKEGKPVFLSIGYATSHGCRVMERESFEDGAVSRILNGHFVAVKVDREERPDVDQVYRAACQAMKGYSGWPLTIVMTPDGKPFFAATFVPREGPSGGPGLREILSRLADTWGRGRQDLLASAEQVARFLKEQAGRVQAGKAPGRDALDAGYRQLRQRYDAVNGGFGGAPKFPGPHDYSFLLRRWKRTGDPEALRMVEHSLARMARGGIHDHLGGGFHRYATDAVWLVPHFGKMLHDQALLAIAFTEAYQATGKAEYAETARAIFRYVLRDMASPEGGFHSSEDADSGEPEGTFYVWRPEEIAQVLGKERGDRFNRFYGMTGSGNSHAPGHAILNIPLPIGAFAEKEGLAPEALARELAEGRERLFAVREKRVRPVKDDRILADWNGLMIAALARGARALEEPAYAEAARKAADFLLATLRDGQGRLLHRYRQGEAAIPAHLDDYAFLAWGLIELHEAAPDPRLLEAAVRLTEEMTARFWDDRAGGLFFTASDAEPLLVRNKEILDGAVPSGNSVAALVTLRLARMAGRPAWEDRAWKIMAAFSDDIGRSPSSHAQLLIALDFAVGPGMP